MTLIPFRSPFVRRPADRASRHACCSGAGAWSAYHRRADVLAAVLAGWRAAARDLAGLCLLLDRQAEQPATPEVAAMLDRATRKDRLLLAVMAGRAGLGEAAAQPAGRSLEERARAGQAVLAA